MLLWFIGPLMFVTLSKVKQLSHLKKKRSPLLWMDLRSNSVKSQSLFTNWAVRVTVLEEMLSEDEASLLVKSSNKSKTHWTQYRTTMVLHSHLGWWCRDIHPDPTASLAYELSQTSLPSILHNGVGIRYSWSNKDPALIIQIKKENSVSPWVLETNNI